MLPSLINFLLLLLTAIVIEYFLYTRWQRYKKLKLGNNSGNPPPNNSILLRRAFLGDQSVALQLQIKASLKKIFQLPLTYIVILTAAGVAQLRAELWTSGTICLLLALIGYAKNTGILETIDAYTKSPDHKELEKSSLDNNQKGDDSSSATPSSIYLWLIVVVLMAFSIFASSDSRRSATQEMSAPITWIASVILGLIIIFWSHASHNQYKITQIRKVLKTRQWGFWFLMLILLLGFFLRTFLLAEHPYPFSGDEASIAMEAKYILNEDEGNLFATSWATQPLWSFMPTALTIKVLGDNIIAIRIVSVIAGTLAILFTYLAASEMFNSAVALTSAMFLAAYPYALHFSRVGVQNIMDSLMSALVFWLIAKSVRTGNSRLSYLAGALGGLCVYTYAGTKLVPILGIIILFLFLRNEQDTSSNRPRYILFFLAGMIISAAPQIAFIARHQNLLLGRLGQEGVFFNGWMAMQVELTGKPVFEIIWDQLTSTFLMYIASPVTGFFFNTPNSYLSMAGGMFFLFGNSIAWARRSKPHFFTLLLWFWSVVFIGGALTIPPVSTRMLMATPVTAIFIGIGIHSMIDYCVYHGILTKSNGRIAICAIVGVLCVQNIYTYMIDYRNNVYFKDKNAEIALESGEMIKDIGREYQVFILGAPDIFSDFPTWRYLAPNNQIMDLREESISTLLLKENQKYFFVAIPENHELLEQIMNKYDTGKNGVFYRKTRGRVILFEYYILTGDIQTK